MGITKEIFFYTASKQHGTHTAGAQMTIIFCRVLWGFKYTSIF